jgi:tRNA threonylcarbamoyladenosine biosynthesis protein TsaE
MSASVLEVPLHGEPAQEAFGGKLARHCRPPLLITLDGDLGAGKTTLVRGFLRALGHPGAVKSPTYTLIEPYDLATASAYHLDLYRLGDAAELEYLGLRDIIGEPVFILVEWPQRGEGWLPEADLRIEIAFSDDGRRVRLAGQSTPGRAVVAALAADL